MTPLLMARMRVPNSLYHFPFIGSTHIHNEFSVHVLSPVSVIDCTNSFSMSM